MKTTLKLLVISILAILTLTGCGKTARESTTDYVLPEGLSDCKVYTLQSSLSILTVIRCPLSTTTTTTSGKNPQHVSVTESSP